MNPTMLFTLKKKWDEFTGRHPRFSQFLMDLFQSGVGEGSVIDVTVTLPDGRTLQSNMRVTQEDVDLLKSCGS